jgi:hypothetical protein
MVLLLVEEGIISFPIKQFSLPFFFHFYSPACLSTSAIVRWNCCPRHLGRYLLRLSYLSQPSLPSLYLFPSLSLSCLDDSLPRSHYHGYSYRSTLLVPILNISLLLKILVLYMLRRALVEVFVDSDISPPHQRSSIAIIDKLVVLECVKASGKKCVTVEAMLGGHGLTSSADALMLFRAMAHGSDHRFDTSSKHLKTSVDGPRRRRDTTVTSHSEGQ